MIDEDGLNQRKELQQGRSWNERALPAISLLACLPSLALIAPTRWALGSPQETVPLPALGANVIWNLATNTVLALCLVIAMFLK